MAKIKTDTFDTLKCNLLIAQEVRVQYGKSCVIVLKAKKDSACEIDVVGKGPDGDAVNFLALDVAPDGTWLLRMNKEVPEGGFELETVDQSTFFPGGDEEPIEPVPEPEPV